MGATSQAMSALDRANEVRFRRSRLLGDVRAAGMTRRSQQTPRLICCSATIGVWLQCGSVLSSTSCGA